MSDPELEKVSLQFQADEHAAHAAAAARVADFQASTAPSSPPAPAPLTPEQEAAAKQKEQAAQAAAFAQAMMPKLCIMAWAVVDRLVQQAAGPELAITDEERAQLAEVTAPVVEKYVSDSIKWVFTTPEGALAFTAAIIYGPKVMAMTAAPASSPPAETSPASPPPVPVVTAEAAHA